MHLHDGDMIFRVVLVSARLAHCQSSLDQPLSYAADTKTRRREPLQEANKHQKLSERGVGPIVLTSCSCLCSRGGSASFLRQRMSDALGFEVLDLKQCPTIAVTPER